MRTHAKILSVTLSAAVLAMTGCSDGDTTLKEADAINNLFDDNSSAINDSAWAVPEEGVFYNTKNYTFAYDVSTTAEGDARPGADKHDLGVDWSTTATSYGDISFYPISMNNGAGDSNFAATEVLEFDSDSDSYESYILAKGENNAIYMTGADGQDWERWLPANTSEGTSWVVDVRTLSDLIGYTEDVAFVYKSVGTVSYAPRYNVNADGEILESAPGATEDLADTTSGTEADNYIVYGSSTGYEGETLDSDQISVVEYNVITDNRYDLDIDGDGTVDFKNTIQVQTTYNFRVSSLVDSTLTSNIGLSEHAGTVTWYWKKDLGVVYETGSLTYPALGYDFGSDENEVYDYEGNQEGDTEWWLSGYNADYDDETYLNSFDVASYNADVADDVVDLAHPAYLEGYGAGFSDGYDDAEDRENDPNSQLWSGYWDADQDDDDNATDVAYEAAFRAGYALGYSRGTADYDADWDAETAPTADTQSADYDGPDYTVDASSLTDIPAAYRAIDYWGNYLDSYGNMDVADYAAGYDGWGVEVLTYDSSVTTGDWNLVKKPSLDDRNEEGMEVYVKLPAIGRLITNSWTKQQTANPAGPEAVN